MNPLEMFQGERFINRFFRKVDNVVWDLTTGKLGITAKDGILTIEGEGDEAQVVVNMFDQFGIPLPAFAQNTPTSSINIGDLIFNDKKLMGWVIKKPDTDKSLVFKLLKPDGTRGEWRPPKVVSFGIDLNGAMVLKNLFNMMPDNGKQNFQSMLMPMMLMGGGSNMDLDKMLPMMLMMQNGMFTGGAASTDPAAAAANPMGNMMQMMLMMQMFKGGGDSKQIFGGSKKTFFEKDEN